MELTYHWEGAYLIPDILLDDGSSYNIGKYGRMRQKYLCENYPSEYLHLVITEKLWKQLEDLEEECHEMLDRPMEQMAKRDEITEKVRKSKNMYGDRPDLLAGIIKLAIAVLELLINRIMIAAVNASEKVLDEFKPITTESCPRMTPLASKYHGLRNIYNELQKRNKAIFAQEHERGDLEIELSDCKGVFKAGKRVELQGRISEIEERIDQMKRHLSDVVRQYGYRNVREFYDAYCTAECEYADYLEAKSKWEKKNDEESADMPGERKIEEYQRKVNESHVSVRMAGGRKR